MTFQTTYLDQILAKQQSQLEQERQNLLEKTIDWLNKYGSRYGIKQAYIFGSLTRQNQFTKNSDIDIAVELTKWHFILLSITSNIKRCSKSPQFLLRRESIRLTCMSKLNKEVGGLVQHGIVLY